MVQRYTFLHKINGNENLFVLNFAKSNNLKVLLPNFCYHFIVFFGNRNIALSVYFRNFAAEIKILRL